MMILFRIILFFFIFLISSEVAFPQIRCAADEMHKSRMMKDTAYAKQYTKFLTTLNKAVAARKNQAARNKEAVSPPDTIYTIPVVVHIIHNNSSGTIGGLGNRNIDDDKIRSQIKVLNEDFRRLNADTSLTRSLFKPVAADARIQFCLANRDPNGNLTLGITRTYSPKSFFDFGGGPDEATLKGLAYWPNDQYLNIWVASLFYGGSTLLGSTQFPEGTGLPGLGSQSTPDNLDGVCIDYRAFGSGGDGFPNDIYSLYYQKGRTTTHEIGHYFGLFHIWGDNFCGDDYCADTPIDASPNQDHDCLDTSNCLGPYTQDMTENYLDYSPDACMNTFSKDQVVRMRTAIQIAPKRNSLLRSNGCCGGGMSEALNAAFQEDFETNSFLSEGWKIYNPDTLLTWSQTSTAGSWNSSGSMYIKNDSIYSSGNPSKNKFYDFLITPFINFSDFDQPVLEFDLAYAKNTLSVTDSLVLSYSILCDPIWMPLLNLYGNQLPTTSVIQNMFVPSPANWKHFKLKLPALANKRFVRLRFEDYSKGGNNLYLDRINIIKTSDKLIVNLYPNPAWEAINIETIFNDSQDVYFQLYNLLGQSVLERETLETESFITTLNVSHLAEGMYILKVSINGQKATKKIIVKH